MTKEQFAELLTLSQPHWLEIAAWIAIIATAITAGYAIIYARHQLKIARENGKILFLMDMDRRWDGHEMKEARIKWRELRNSINETIEKEHSQLSHQDRLNKASELCSNKLHEMLKRDVDGYAIIMSIMGFFETIGYVIDKKFTSSDEIAGLYGDSIQEFDRLCFSHLEKRREDRQSSTGAPTDLYEHARNLIFATREYYEKMANPTR